MSFIIARGEAVSGRSTIAVREAEILNPVPAKIVAAVPSFHSRTVTGSFRRTGLVLASPVQNRREGPDNRNLLPSGPVTGKVQRFHAVVPVPAGHQRGVCFIVRRNGRLFPFQQLSSAPLRYRKL